MRSIRIALACLFVAALCWSCNVDTGSRGEGMPNYEEWEIAALRSAMDDGRLSARATHGVMISSG